MNNIATTSKTTFSLTPTTLDEAMKYAEIMAKSSIVPKAYQGKPGDILLVVQMGAELGLKPIQALQNIAVINGKPAVYGDAMLALAQRTTGFDDIKESYDEKTQTASCTVKHKGQSDHTVTFSVDDAKKAGLWGKIGPWSQYPKRMLQMRARGFAIRDKFTYALNGLISAEEARDYPVETMSKTQSISQKLDSMINTIEPAYIESELNNVTETNIEDDYIEDRELTEQSNNIDTLISLVNEHDIPFETTKKWCDKAGVEFIEDLSDDQALSCVKYIERHYSK